MRELAHLHGMPRRAPDLTLDVDSETAPCGGVPNILDAVIRTILSQHTSDARSRLAWAGFEARFGRDYEAVRRAPMADVVQAIASGGLAQSKSKVIKELMEDVYIDYGALSLEHLRTLANADIKSALMRYRGVGLKTASCILLLCLGRDSFAVDTHVLRVAKRLGWVPPSATCDQAHGHLDACIPPALHYPLHVLFVRHGKACPACAARPPAHAQAWPSCPVDAYRP